MRIVVQGRGAGKTYKLVQWVLAGESTHTYPFWSRVILVPTHQMCEDLRKQYPALDYRQVFTWHEWGKAKLGLTDVELALDNVDLLLAQMLGHTPDIVTMTGAVWNAEL